MRTYQVNFKVYQHETERNVLVTASNKREAYWNATYMVRDMFGVYPYSAWVDSVRQNNGRRHTFNNNEGHAY